MFYKNFLKVLTVIGVVSTMAACSSDDDDVNSPTNKSCKIVNVVSKSGGGSSNDGYTMSQFSYDNDGRIVGYQWKDNYTSEPVKYSYGPSLVVETISNSEFKSYLTGGLIKSTETGYGEQTYEYDSTNQLTGIKIYTGSNHYTKFYWSNGDIVKWEGYTDGELDYEATCTYSDYPNTLSLLYWDDSDYYLLPAAFYAAGYYGKVSKHLPLKISVKGSYEGGNKLITFSYSEFNKEGYPSRININQDYKYINQDQHDEDQFDLTWK